MICLSVCVFSKPKLNYLQLVVKVLASVTLPFLVLYVSTILSFFQFCLSSHLPLHLPIRSPQSCLALCSSRGSHSPTLGPGYCYSWPPPGAASAYSTVLQEGTEKRKRVYKYTFSSSLVLQRDTVPRQFLVEIQKHTLQTLTRGS